jgi:hypothetical protein
MDENTGHGVIILLALVLTFIIPIVIVKLKKIKKK